MKKTALALTFVMTLLFAFPFCRIFVQPVESQSFETIFIRADGSVEGTDKIQRDGDVYTFAGDIGTDEGSYGIIVQKDNIVIDGAGFLLKGAGPFDYFDIFSHGEPIIVGIGLEQRKNVTIKNLQIAGFNVGFSGNCTNIKIINNTITNNAEGILFEGSANNIIIDNNIAKNGGSGIYLYQATNSTVSNNNITDSYQGIYLSNSLNNTVSENSIKNCRTNGIGIWDSNDNVIYANNLSHNIHGIGLSGSFSNTICRNNISNNSYNGLWIADAESSARASANNIIMSNNLMNNARGIYIREANNNKFHLNNFINNSEQIYDMGIEYPQVNSPSVNTWDDNENGNYWSDYLTRYTNASEIGDSGIGDTPYVIDANNVDNYPLMAPVDFTGPSILVLSPANKTYDEGSIPLNFTLNEAVTQITYRLDGEENVAISGNMTLIGLPDGGHNVTVYAIDEAGNTGASETIYFNVDVPEPFPTTLAIASVITIAVVSLGLLVYFKKRKQ